jgi:hypothetical protein
MDNDPIYGAIWNFWIGSDCYRQMEENQNHHPVGIPFEVVLY